MPGVPNGCSSFASLTRRAFGTRLIKALAAIHHSQILRDMMVIFPDTEKKLKSKISSYKSSMKKEKKDIGFISDGSGKRYILFSLYFVLNDLDKFEEYVGWYNEEFPDDMGEPIQKLCWSLGLYRANKIVEARFMLAELMLLNLYLIPHVIGENLEHEHDIWHSTNFHYLDYVHDLPKEVKDNIKNSEIEWMRECYNSPDFSRIRKRYIEIYHKLLTVREIEERRVLLKESYSLLSSL
ncbi:hypothetical protein NX722_03020 [Endozoicomonas gorgoniicola]|uniref:Uncharacterized protein n=1 Tax=Endozoicomonas gorgoniicola TaxID=1234144 RepID=A0ABT3MQI5_9GAMM|nr:hypothetical protein [Endozoicomonas gorgoniicola]MCW7551632.1 hypothetical protein [Endozoicomonas gorgoniicola]